MHVWVPSLLNCTPNMVQFYLECHATKSKSPESQQNVCIKWPKFGPWASLVQQMHIEQPIQVNGLPCVRHLKTSVNRAFKIMSRNLSSFYTICKWDLKSFSFSAIFRYSDSLMIERTCVSVQKGYPVIYFLLGAKAPKTFVLALSTLYNPYPFTDVLREKPLLRWSLALNL